MIERFMQANTVRGEVRFRIVVRGAYGAIEFHFGAPKVWNPSIYQTELRPFFAYGVEFHKRVGDDAANRPQCDLLSGAPCYHDGTSLWASEYIMPLFLSGGSEAVYSALEARYRDWASE